MTAHTRQCAGPQEFYGGGCWCGAAQANESAIAAATGKSAAVSKPVRVQLRRTKGWRMPPNTVKVDRGTLYGNPFPLSYFGGDRVACVAAFRELVELPPMRDLLPRLRGKNVACWCPLDELCHGDVWLELANGDPAIVDGTATAALREDVAVPKDCQARCRRQSPTRSRQSNKPGREM